MEIIKNFKIKKLDKKIANLGNTYISIKSAGRSYTISLLVRYNVNLDLRSFCYTVRAYERGAQQVHCSGAQQLQTGPRLKKHLSVCYYQTR